MATASSLDAFPNRRASSAKDMFVIFGAPPCNLKARKMSCSSLLCQDARQNLSYVEEQVW